MIEMRPLCRLEAVVGEPQVTRGGPLGERRYIPVLSGKFIGARLRGTIQPGGADCQLLRGDGVADLDVRLTLHCDDDTVIFMMGRGLRHGPPEVLKRMAAGEEVDPSLYYFREAILFEAPPGNHAWLNRILAIGTGKRGPNAVTIEAFEVL